MARNVSCGHCGGLLPVTSGPGRPRRYCSIPCRRQREFALRRARTKAGQVVQHVARLDRLRAAAQVAKGARS